MNARGGKTMQKNEVDLLEAMHMLDVPQDVGEIKLP